METLAPNIFLVEDDPFYNNVVKNTLEKNNFKVKSFTTSGEYLEAIQSEVPDLVIMDYKLDEANGIDLLERTKLKTPIQK